MSTYAALGESLTNIFVSFDSRASAVRGMLDLRGLAASEASLAALQRAELELSSLEAEVAAARSSVQRECELISSARELQVRASDTAARLAHVQAHCPELLPGDAEVAQPPPPQEAPEEAPEKTATPRRPLGECATSSSASNSALPKPRGRPGARVPPRMALVTEAELAGAPQYMRARLDVGKVNAAVAEASKVLSAKYALLSTPLSQLRSEAERKRHLALKTLEQGSEKGTFFFSEEELKAAGPPLKQDATGRNVLAVLRHVGRLKEFKHGGVRCWRLCE